ncbi:14961_t:CDS:2, partial [Funneliformis geosporum]
RNELENDDIINDMLSFSSNSCNKYFEILRTNEEDFFLEEIIDNSRNSNILYLMKSSRPGWNTLNGKLKLDYGHTLGFKSKEDWMKKTNLFVEADGINIMNFVKIGLSVGLSRCDNFNFELNSTYQYTECGKVLLGFNKYLEPTEKFTETIEEAINSEDPVNFMRIIEEYGRFIPTEVIFGGRVYFRDVEKLETHSGENTMNGASNLEIGHSKFSNSSGI